MAALRLSDRAVIMDTGEVVFSGTAKEVLENEQLGTTIWRFDETRHHKTASKALLWSRDALPVRRQKRHGVIGETVSEHGVERQMALSSR